MYGAKREFRDLTGVVTLRYDVCFRDPAPGWAARLTGPPGTVAWLAARLRKDQDSCRGLFAGVFCFVNWRA